MNFVEAENARMKLATYCNLFRDEVIFPPNLHQVWGAKHEKDLKSYFYDHIEGQIQYQRIGYWIAHEIMSALSPRTKTVTKDS